MELKVPAVKPDIPVKYVDLVYMPDTDRIMPIIHNEIGNRVKDLSTGKIYHEGEEYYKKISESYHTSVQDILARMYLDKKLSVTAIIKSQLMRDYISFADAVGYKPPYNESMIREFLNLKLCFAQDVTEFCAREVSYPYVMKAMAESQKDAENPDRLNYEQVVKESKKF